MNQGLNQNTVSAIIEVDDYFYDSDVHIGLIIQYSINGKPKDITIPIMAVLAYMSRVPGYEVQYDLRSLQPPDSYPQTLPYWIRKNADTAIILYLLVRHLRMQSNMKVFKDNILNQFSQS